VITIKMIDLMRNSVGFHDHFAHAMTVLIILAAWILVVSLVAGLCAAARCGDVQLEHARSPAGLGDAPRPIVVPSPAHARLTGGAEPAADLVGAAGATR
jgi:hypothetical protein